MGYRWMIALGMMAALMTGCASVPGGQYGQEDSLAVLCEQSGVIWHWDSVSQVVTLSKGDTTAKALIGSEIVLFKNEQVVLSEPLRRERDEIVVPDDFRAKVIRRFGPVISRQERRTYCVIIDPGHGGKDPGAIGVSGLNEKEVVLDIATRVKKNLERKNFKVRMTRSSDQFISLEERTEIPSEINADLFVSIHANASPSNKATGIEVYGLRDLTWAEKTEDQRRKNQRTLFSKLQMDKGNSDLEKIVADMLFSYKEAESPTLAEYVAQGLATKVSARNRGTKQAGYFVLRNTLIPAVLVEVGFVSNSREEGLLKSPAYRQKIADSLADSIWRYANR